MSRLTGVIAAAATPIRDDLSIDHDKLVRHCGWLLEAGGCDGVNLLGTTGEATSFSVDQRLAAMTVIARSGLPLDRFMVGTGAAALADAVRLTSAAKSFGYAGALLIPPFYYKGIDGESLEAYVQTVIDRVGAAGLALYLYHIPQNTGVPYPFEVVERLFARNGKALAGLKDSAGDIAYATELARRVPGIDVFPSSEGSLGRATELGFAGCISATTNITGPLAQRAWRHQGTSQGETAVAEALALRDTLGKFPLVAAVKRTLADMTGDPAWSRLQPPLRALDDAEWTRLSGLLTQTAYPSAIKK